MVAGPEVSRLVEKYEAKHDSSKGKHHEECNASQKVFLKRVEKLYAVIKEMSNPFEESSQDVFTLDSKNIADPIKAESVLTHHARGKEQCKSFVDSLNKESSSFYEQNTKNKMEFFVHEKETTKSKEKIVKEDCGLFSRLFISCQNRDCDLREFFKYENQSFPASLNDGGKLYTCQKSQMVQIFKDKVNLPDSEPSADSIILDGTAMVNAYPLKDLKNI